MTHETPKDDVAWAELASHALDVGISQLRGLGPIKPAGEGAYAARRVLYEEGDGRLVSHTVVARDEENRAAKPHQTTFGGTTFWPYAIGGCYGCGLDCDRHGDTFDRRPRQEA